MAIRQALTTPDNVQRGDAVSASWLNGIMDRVFSYFRVGPGLQVQRMNGQLLLSLTPKPTTGGTSAASGLQIYSAATKAELPTDVDTGSIGVTTGASKKGYQFISTAWICITHFEAL